MKLSDLLKKTDSVFQFLNESVVNVTAGKRQTKVTFVTGPDKINPGDLLPGRADQAQYIGLILWVPREEALKLINADNGQLSCD